MEWVNGNDTHPASENASAGRRDQSLTPSSRSCQRRKARCPSLQPRQPRLFLYETLRPARDPAETVMAMLANRIWHVALARVEAGTIVQSLARLGKERQQNWWEGNTCGVGAETGVDQWPVPTVDLRHLDIDTSTLSFLSRLCD